MGAQRMDAGGLGKRDGGEQDALCCADALTQ